MELSLYPLTNQKRKDAEIKEHNDRILAARAAKAKKVKPPPYNMLTDIMTKFGVEKPEDYDWGPGGLYGRTREELEEMERIANLTPSSHGSSI